MGSSFNFGHTIVHAKNRKIIKKKKKDVLKNYSKGSQVCIVGYTQLRKTWLWNLQWKSELNYFGKSKSLDKSISCVK